MTRASAMLAGLLLSLLPHAAALAQAAASTPRAPAPTPIHALEQAIETRSGALLLPGGGIGTLTVTPCSGCRPLALLAGSTTGWMLGERSVGFAELSRVLATGPRVPVLVFYRGSDLALLRVVARVSSQAPAGVRR